MRARRLAVALALSVAAELGLLGSAAGAGLLGIPMFDTRDVLTPHGTTLYLNGRAVHPVGVNAYELATWWGRNAGCGAQVSDADVDQLFADLPYPSLVRVWAFQGTMATDVNTHARDWAPLDRIVAAAARRGQKLIVALSSQDGVCDDGHWHDRSWYAGGFRKAFDETGRGLTPTPYFQYLQEVVGRYASSPAIGMWEPVNEPEASDCAPGVVGHDCYAQSTCPNELAGYMGLRSFFDTVGGQIHRIDPNHIVGSGVIGTGQCGAAGSYYEALHRSAGIDAASYHDYGEPYRPMPGDQFNGLSVRLTQMRRVNKPLVVGEIGIPAAGADPGCVTLQQRRDLVSQKLDAGFANGVAAMLPWNWVPIPPAPCDYNFGPRDPLAQLLVAHRP